MTDKTPDPVPSLDQLRDKLAQKEMDNKVEPQVISEPEKKDK